MLFRGFQSTRPHGARRTRRIMTQWSAKFQSTRPHGARRPYPSSGICAYFVSIHAPARGATSQACHACQFHEVSIHAPARGATHTTGMIDKDCRRFNPRARTGRDGAVPLILNAAICFNPRARTGRDTSKRIDSIESVRFQSTRPHGARLN